MDDKRGRKKGELNSSRSRAIIIAGKAFTLVDNNSRLATRTKSNILLIKLNQIELDGTIRFD